MGGSEQISERAAHGPGALADLGADVEELGRHAEQEAGASEKGGDGGARADLDRAALAALPLPVTIALDPTDPGAAERAAAYRAAGKEVAAEVAVKYGMFLQTMIDFVLIALVIFLFLKAYNRMRKPAEAAPAGPSEEVLLLREIRDALQK